MPFLGGRSIVRPSALSFAMLLGACGGTAHRVREGKAPPAESAPIETSSSAGQVFDSAPTDEACSGYSLDGVRVGTPISEAGAVQMLRPLPPEEHPATDAGERFYAFHASRPGRRDYVRVGADGEGGGAKVTSVRGTILTAPKDPWPMSLFALIGNPRRVKVDEWYWWSAPCGAALSLKRIPPLGPAGEELSYIIEIRPFP
jgi:hypothetical protein